MAKDFAFKPYGSDHKQHDSHVKAGFDDMAGKWEKEKGPKKVYIDHHPHFDEYKVHTGGRGSKGYYTNDKADAIGTAKAEHGHDSEIVHRSKAYGPEPD